MRSMWSESSVLGMLDSRFQRRLLEGRWIIQLIVQWRLCLGTSTRSCMPSLTLLTGAFPGILAIILTQFFLPDSAITFLNRDAIFEVDACDLVILLFDLCARAVVNLLSATIAAL